jgi:hypothetical protein
MVNLNTVKSKADAMREATMVARMAKALKYEGLAKEAYDDAIRRISLLANDGLDRVDLEIIFNGCDKRASGIDQIGTLLVQMLRDDGFHVPNRVSVNHRFIAVSWEEKSDL